jgi:hypothetical protein
MGFETVSNGGDKNYAPTKYVRYTMPEDGELKDNMMFLKKDQSITGYFLRSFEREFKGKVRKGHILVNSEGLHIVIPDNKEVTQAFESERIVKGALTRFTYLGKKQFTTKTGETARAVKALIEQDKDQVVTFEGELGCEVISGNNTNSVAKQKLENNTITANEVPF